jgi:hypothetical protein
MIPCSRQGLVSQEKAGAVGVVGKGRGARAAVAGVPSVAPSFTARVVLRLAAAKRSASQAVGVRAPTIGGNRRSGCKA